MSSVDDKWIKNTALLFYQIFSVDYDDEDEAFINKLLAGGGGNSTLCSTWMHLNSCFVQYRITESAYSLLNNKVLSEDRSKIKLDDNVVYISRDIYKDYRGLKGAENRIKAVKFFHFDHNPSNKKVLRLLYDRIKLHKEDEGFLEDFIEYTKSIQTIDLITVYEDDIRTSADRKSKNGPLTALERDDILETKFYRLENAD